MRLSGTRAFYHPGPKSPKIMDLISTARSGEGGATLSRQVMRSAERGERKGREPVCGEGQSIVDGRSSQSFMCSQLLLRISACR